MRVLLDTNVIISAVIWGGIPRKILDMARNNIITLYTSIALLDELLDVLSRDKFSSILNSKDITPDYIMQRYAMLANIVKPEMVPRIVRDVDDDEVIACATAAKVEIVVSGDKDLLVLHPYQNISMLNPTDAFSQITLRSIL